MKLKGLSVIVAAVGCCTLLLAQSLTYIKKPASFTQWQEGDIIFQESISPQCDAIQLASHSNWSHVGMLLKQNGQWVVLEAIHPVTFTPVNEFVSRGNGHFMVSRLRDTSVLTTDVLACMHKFGERQEGKYYDMEFEWSDDRMYCSELVYKLYLSCTGIEVGRPKPMREFDLSHPAVKEVMEERYDNHIPYDELMIAPGGIAECDRLVTVWEEPVQSAKFSKK
ncbi:MAG: YiiX family permuted papain-like enzyme [Flavobacteriales bacterium]|nr:YiiX family permuted papain-like enzyme [Flavobacteriales bacterium]